MRAEAAPSLAKLERWMQAILVHPESADAGLVSKEAVREIPSARVSRIVKPSGELSPVERLGIYQGMYLLRMKDALASDYPGLSGLLGEHDFFHLVADYVEEHPSKSYTLNVLGRRFPKWIERHAPARKKRLWSDLARFELAMTEVFDESEVPPIEPAAIRAIRESDWPKARLVPIPALRLVTLDSPADLVFDAVRNEKPIPRLRRGKRNLVVYRRDFAVRRRVLEPGAFALLEALVAGLPLGRAVERARRAVRRLPESTISETLRDAVAAGFFSRIAVTTSKRRARRK